MSAVKNSKTALGDGTYDNPIVANLLLPIETEDGIKYLEARSSVQKLSDETNLDDSTTGASSKALSTVNTDLANFKTSTNQTLESLNSGVSDLSNTVEELGSSVDSLNDNLSQVSSSVEDIQEKIESGEIGGGGSGSGDGSNPNVLAPAIISPTEDATNVPLYCNLSAGPYRNAFVDDARVTRIFQIAKQTNTNWETGDDLLEFSTNADSININAPLLAETGYKWRCRDKSSFGLLSAWSDEVNFTTGTNIAVATPTLTVTGADSNEVPENPTLSGSPFALNQTGVTPQHSKTSWFCYAVTEESERGALVWSSQYDTEHLESITMPFDILTEGGTFEFAMVYYDAVYGQSAEVTVRGTCTDSFLRVNTPVLTLNCSTDNVKERPVITAQPFGVNQGEANHIATTWKVVKLPEGTTVHESVRDAVNLTSYKVPKGVLQVSTQYRFECQMHTDTEGYADSDVGSITGTTMAEFPQSVIGTPGEMGFGVGVCPFDDELILSQLGLTPMPGYDEETNDNYGNYQHTNGSIMVWIPAFAIKPSDAETPNYEMHGADAIDIIGLDQFDTEEEANTLGYAVHRAFINGGQLVPGFFVDKYIASRGTNGSSTVALSVKNGKMISLVNNGNFTCSQGMPGCNGTFIDSIVLSKARGAQFNLQTCFMESALAIISKIHGQFARLNANSAACGWLDQSGTNNFPKGCNNGSLHDHLDSTVTYTTGGDSGSSAKPLTGSGTPFNKTTHNGQACGVADINGCILRVTFGLSYLNGYKVLLESVKHSEITTANVQTASLYEACSPQCSGDRWGKGGASALYFDHSGPNRALCGVMPKSGGSSSAGSNAYGNDYCNLYSYPVLHVGGHWSAATDAGAFYRYLHYSWSYSVDYYGFRVAAYVEGTL